MDGRNRFNFAIQPMQSLMKKFWIFCALVFAGFTGYGQTTLAAGDVAIIGYKINPGSSVNGHLIIISRTSIAPGQSIGVTNKFYYSNAFQDLTDKGSSSGSNRSSSHGYIYITFNEGVSAGEVFTINWTSSTVVSSKGQAYLSGTFDFGNVVERIVWLYEGTIPASSPNIINALMYSPGSGNGNKWDDHNDKPTGINFVNISTHSAPFTAVNLNTTGASDKCGTWYSTTLKPSLTADLSQTFYKSTGNTLDNWEFSSSNVDPCDLSDVTTKVVNYLESNVQMNALILSFGKKRAGSSSLTKLGYWYRNGVEQSSGYNPWLSETASNLKSSTVYVYDELTLGSFSSSSSSNSLETFYVGDLRIIDSTGCPGKVIVSPGDILDIQYKVSMSDKLTQSSNVLPKISLSSNVDAASNQHYAQIAPTGAMLNGNYEYKLYIGSPGWHRIYSPISTTWSNVTPSSSFVFTYGSTGSTRNIYYYDPAGPLNSSGVSQFWQYVSSSDNASDRPVNVYFAPGGSETPCVLTFNGTLKYADLDAGTTLSSSTSANTLNTSSPGYGAPWYGTNYNGWNLYGNHGFSFIDVSSLKTNYYDLSQIPNVSMSVYVWDPYDKTSSIGSSTLNNYYIHNGQTGDSKALYIPPFTAFFINTTNPGSAAYPIGRKAMSASNHTGISNKTAETIGLVTVGPTGLENTVFASPIPESLSSKNSLNYNAVSSGLAEGALFVHEDSNFYRIRQIDEPVLYRELPLAFTSAIQNETYTVKNHADFPTNLNSYLIDFKEQKVIDLGKADYSFESDTSTNLNRFKWILSKTSIGMDEVFKFNSLSCFIDGNGTLRISNCLESSSIEVLDALGNSMAVIQKDSNENEAQIEGVKFWPKGLYVVKSSNGMWQKIMVL